MSLTKEQVECLEEHLPYEVLMLRYTFGKLATPDPHDLERDVGVIRGSCS